MKYKMTPTEISKLDEAIKAIRPILQKHGGDIKLVGVTEDKIVQVRLLGSCKRCPGAENTRKWGIEYLIKKKASGIKGVVIVGKPRKRRLKFLRWKNINPFTVTHPAIWNSGHDAYHGLSKLESEHFLYCRATEACAKCHNKKAVINLTTSNTYDPQVHSYCHKCSVEEIKRQEEWSNRGGKPGDPIIYNMGNTFRSPTVGRSGGYRNGW